MAEKEEGLSARHADGFEEQMRGAIAQDRRPREEDASVGPELDGILGERRGGGGSGRVARGARD
jgi:hypothetical protein